MARRKKLFWIFLPFGLLLLVWFLMGMPISDERCYGCEICRARVERDSRFGIPLRPRHRVSDFERYYLKSVDPHHRHRLRQICETNYYGFVREYSDGIALVWTIPEEAELAIVKALPDRATRKAFCEQFESRRDDEHLYDRCFDLMEAFVENRDRADWIELIKKYGLYPKKTK